MNPARLAACFAIAAGSVLRDTICRMGFGRLPSCVRPGCCLLTLLAWLLVCCDAPPRAELSAPTPTEEQPGAAVGMDRQLVQRLDGVLNDLAQHVRATKDAPAPQRVARYPVRLARFRNASATADDEFNAYRDRVLRMMVQLARRHGLNLHDQAGSDDATELRIVVFDLPESAGAAEARWLMRLAAVGRDHAGRREMIWSDQVALPGP